MTQPNLKPTRLRWLLRFSLRTLFVLLTVACIAGGWFINRVRQQQAVVKWVEENHGFIVYDLSFHNAPFFNADADGQPNPAQRWVHDHLGLHYVARPKVVYLISMTSPPDNRHRERRDAIDLQPLASLSDLELLEIHGLNVEG